MDGPTPTQRDMENETRHMALFGIVARVANAGIVFLTQILFARTLGAADFGVYATANAMMLLVAGFATLGLTAMPQRFWPAYEAEDDLARQRGLLRFACWGPFAAGTAFAIAGCSVAYLASPLLSPAVSTATCLAMLTVPALAALDVVEGIALLKSWKRLAYGLTFIVRPLLVPFIFLGAWLIGVTADATLAVIAVAAATWMASLALIILLRRKLRASLPDGPVVMNSRIWLLAGLPVMLIDGAFMLMTSTDIVLLAVFSSDATVGAYGAAARLVALVAFVHQGLTWASGHHFSALHLAGNSSGLADYAARMTRWTFLPSLAAAVVMATAAPLILMLFGTGFEGGESITSVLLIGLLFRAAIGPGEQLLIMTDNQMACAYAYAWAFVVNFGLCIGLIPQYGAIGAAIATSIAYGAASLIIAREVRLRLGFDIHIVAIALASWRKPAHA
jgi:O-antigen/teichoic acid export membrane protein